MGLIIPILVALGAAASCKIEAEDSSRKKKLPPPFPGGPDHCAECHTSPRLVGSLPEDADESVFYFKEPQPASLHNRHLGLRHGLLIPDKFPPVPCSRCHDMPDENNHPRPTEKSAALNIAGHLSAVGEHYDPMTKSCRVYCHSSKNVPWNGAADPDAVPNCSTTACHNNDDHDRWIKNEATTCHGCHPDTTGEDGALKKDGKHLNGQVDLIADVCGACHADPPSNHADSGLKASDDCGKCHPEKPTTPFVTPDFPFHRKGGGIDPKQSPISLKAEDQLCISCHSLNPAEGAHQSHLHPLGAEPVACPACHTPPTAQTGLLEHIARGRADWPVVNFKNGIAKGGIYARDETVIVPPVPSLADLRNANGNCTVYCHGKTLPEGQKITPLTWTDADKKAGACGACHSIPPKDKIHFPGIQPQDCPVCHAAFPAGHVNGRID